MLSDVEGELREVFRRDSEVVLLLIQGNAYVSQHYLLALLSQAVCTGIAASCYTG